MCGGGNNNEDANLTINSSQQHGGAGKRGRENEKSEKSENWCSEALIEPWCHPSPSACVPAMRGYASHSELLCWSACEVLRGYALHFDTTSLTAFGLVHPTPIATRRVMNIKRSGSQDELQLLATEYRIVVMRPAVKQADSIPSTSQLPCVSSDL